MMGETIAITKHNAFTNLNGINGSMGIYEQLILNFDEEGVEIVVQHNGKKGIVSMVFQEPFMPGLAD